MKHLKYYLGYKAKQFRKLFLYFHRLYLAQLCMGIAIGTILSNFSYVIIGLLGLCVILLGRRSWSLLGIGLLCGGLIYLSWFGPDRMHLIQNFYGKDASIVGVVVSEPDAADFNQQAVLSVPELPQLVLATVPAYPRLNVGDKISLKGKLENPREKYDSGYATYLNSQGIFYITSSSTSEVIESTNGISALFVRLRKDLQQHIKQYLIEPQSTLLSGILLGAKQDLSAEFKTSLTATGTSHIVAVSGYNVMLVVAGLLSLAGILPRKLVLIFTAFGLGAFLLLVGVGNLSAQRAVIMGFVLLISLGSGRKGALPLSLLYAVTFMLIIYPLAWLSISWQLSVGAMLGLIIFGSGWSYLLQKAPELVKSNLVATLAVMVMTLPVSLSTFGQISFISLLANILVLPFIPIASYIGILGISLSYVSESIAKPILAMCEVLLRLVIKIIQLLGSISWASTKDVLAGVIFFIFIFLLWLLGDFLLVRNNFKKASLLEA